MSDDAAAATTIVVYGGTRDRRLAVQRALIAAGYRVRIASSLAELSKTLTGDVRLLVALSAVQDASHGITYGILSATIEGGGERTTDAADIVDRVRARLNELA